MRVLCKMFAFFAITIAVAIDTVTGAKVLSNKPDFLTPCHLSDSNFNKCFAQNFQNVLHEWKDGIPGYKSYGPIDPLHVKRVSISQDAKNPTVFNAELTNLIVTGISNAVVKHASFNPKTLHSEIILFLPKLRFDSDYKLNGRILNLALNANGKSLFEIEKLSMLLNIELKLRDEKDYTFADIDKLKLKITEVGSLHVHFHNLFNGQNVLEDTTNAAFNENWRDFYELLHPAISQAIEVLLKDRLSKAYAYVPGNYFIEDIPKAAEYKG